MKRKILVVTGSRADYGLLFWILKRIQESPKLELLLIVTGTHLCSEHGYTYRQITEDGFKICRKVDMVISGDSSSCISKSIGVGCIGFAQVYEDLKPDIILVLGDRYEILSAVMTSIPFRIPVAHIAGGEVTEGAIDDQIRHAITKASHLHFAGSDIYANNIKSMGEEDWRVYNVGDTGIEAIKNCSLLEKEELFLELGLAMEKKTILVTLHPTTLNSAETEMSEAKCFFEVLSDYCDINIVITYPNLDNNSSIIIDEIKKLEGMENIYVFKNLGNLRYLSLVKNCDMMLGNSSSGIAEAPYFKIPVVNYGERQKGRLKAKNIIDVLAGDKEKLRYSINKALYDKEFMQFVKTTKSIYGEGNTSEEIVRVLEAIEINEILIKKKLEFK